MILNTKNFMTFLVYFTSNLRHKNESYKIRLPARHLMCATLKVMGWISVSISFDCSRETNCVPNTGKVSFSNPLGNFNNSGTFSNQTFLSLISSWYSISWLKCFKYCSPSELIIERSSNSMPWFLLLRPDK